MSRNRIYIEKYMRYMDDGRLFIAPIKRGWRWIQGELQYMKRWSGEDSNLTETEDTRRIMQEAMQEVLRCLRFTTEVGEGEDEWLATLDMMIRVEEDNSISYIHHKKPTTTNTVVQRRSALDENSGSNPLQ